MRAARLWVGDGPVAAGRRAGAEFADVWCAIPKVAFSRALDGVQGNARLAEASLAERRRSKRVTRTRVCFAGAPAALVDHARVAR